MLHKEKFLNIVSILKKCNIFISIGIAIFLIYTCFLYVIEASLYQGVLVLGTIILLSVLFLFGLEIVKKTYIKLSLILILYIIIAGVAFHPTVTNIFRSDYWLIAPLFVKSQGNFSLGFLRDILFFEMFGDLRFQPIAHLLMFLRYLAFGNEVVLYNILNITLHIIVGFLVFSILYKHNRSIQFSLIFGALFLVLPNQFDTVNWTYHIYVIVATILVLLSIYLAYKYTEKKRGAYLLCSVITALLSAFLYEPTILTPALLFPLILSLYRYKKKIITKQNFFVILFVIIFTYFFYSFITTIGMLSIKSSKTMSLQDVITWNNIFNSLKYIFVNFWESTFIKNVGVMPVIDIRDIVYVSPATVAVTNITSFLKVVLGIFMFLLFRTNKNNIHIILTLTAIAMAYIFILFMGRLTTNDPAYIMAQPRYQYLFNAILSIVSGLFLWNKYHQKYFKYIIIAILVSVFAWNIQNISYANNQVTQVMSRIDTHYYGIKKFFSTNPSAKLFLDFTPDTQKQLCLGTDIAMDILFKKRITKFLRNASHIYDGHTFKENITYQDNIPDTYLKDFTIEWMYQHSSTLTPQKEIEIIGDNKTYPKISLIPDGFIEIAMVNIDTKKIDVYKFKHSYSLEKWTPSLGFWSSMIVEKNEEDLCFIFEGILQDKIKLTSKYENWNKDGVYLLGGYYKGVGTGCFIGHLSIQADVAKYRCGKHMKGDKMNVDIKAPW